jgi:pyruvate dehydrogenase E1 component
MVTEHEDVFFYVTVMNENYAQPAMPEGAEEGILRGMHVVREADGEAQLQLLGSGTILREVLAAADLLRDEWDAGADVWSVTSYPELRRDGMEAERWSRLHPTEPARQPYVGRMLEGRAGPVVAASDYIRQLPDMIRPWVDRPYTVLGTDGYGRSDYRKTLRRFFEVDRHHVVVAALEALGRPEDAAAAIARYEIDPEREAPWRT